MQKTIVAAKDELRKMHRQVSLSGLISQFTFGFWLSLLHKRYDTNLWRTALYRAFPNAPKPLLRSNIYRNVARIRDLRNRIVHHEPVLERNLERDHQLVIEVTSWMCADTAAWIDYHSEFHRD